MNPIMITFLTIFPFNSSQNLAIGFLLHQLLVFFLLSRVWDLYFSYSCSGNTISSPSIQAHNIEATFTNILFMNWVQIYEPFSFLTSTLNMPITQPLFNLKPLHVIEAASHFLGKVSIFLVVFVPLTCVLGDHDSILEFLFSLMLLLNLSCPFQSINSRLRYDFLLLFKDCLCLLSWILFLC